MDRPGRILHLEDEEDWLEEVADTLREHGYYVVGAQTTQDALALLRESYYHLLIIDKSMIPNDGFNEEGQEFIDALIDPEWVPSTDYGEYEQRLVNLLKAQSLAGAVTIIILTGYPNFESQHKAFFKQHVKGYFSKLKYDSDVFLQNVNRVFLEEVRIQRDLAIQWVGPREPEEIAKNLRIGRDLRRPKNELITRIAAELDDLLCRLYFDPVRQVERIVVRFFAAGMTGTAVLLVQPFYVEQGAGREQIVKVGSYHTIDLEYQNYKKYVQGFIGGGRRTEAINLRRTPLLGGLSYSLLGASGEEVEDLGQFYQRSTSNQIQPVLEELFDHVCRLWYANLDKLAPINLATHYQDFLGFTWDRLHGTIQRLKGITITKESIAFEDLSEQHTYPHPLRIMADRELTFTTYSCTTHGDLNPTNVLLGRQDHHVWLIDFQRTGRGHYLRDVAELDAVIRFQLISEQEASLEERWALEKNLLQANNFYDLARAHAAFPTTNRALSKAYMTSLHLRQLAARFAPRRASKDLVAEYVAAQAFYAFNMVRFVELSTLQRQHALLSASLHTTWLDENGYLRS